MDRKGIIAISLAIITLLVWSHYYQKQTQQIAEARQAEAQALADKAAAEKAAADKANSEKAASTAPATATAPGDAATPATAPAAAPTAPAAPERQEKLSTGLTEYVFTSHGGGLAQVTLSKHLGEHGQPVQLNHLGSIPIGALSSTAGTETSEPFEMKADPATGEVTFERTDAKQLKVRKTFTLPKADAKEPYLTTVSVTFSNLTGQPMQVPAYFVHTGSSVPIHPNDLATYTGFGWYHGGDFQFKDASSFSTGMLFSKQEAPTFTDTRGDVSWCGVADQYFTTILTPRSGKGAGVWAHHSAIDKTAIGEATSAATWPRKASAPNNGPTVALIDGALQMSSFTLTPNQSVTTIFDLYTGPREYSRLLALGSDQDLMMNFGKFRAVSKVLLATMNWLHSKVGSYAIAIVLLTILIRGLMWPLQNKATRSMKRMQALQPEMTALKEKYKDDPQRMNQELMKLYKVYQINPVAGCLPMFVQIPVFFGFYNMLGGAVELRNATFFWVKDLSQPDTVGHLFGRPDWPINILPLCMAITMLGQMKLSPKSGDPMQQRIFMFMPVIFVMFCYNYASALALYWTVQNIFSMVQLYITRDQPIPALQKVATPGKTKRG